MGSYDEMAEYLSRYVVGAAQVHCNPLTTQCHRNNEDGDENDDEEEEEVKNRTAAIKFCINLLLKVLRKAISFKIAYGEHF